MMQPQEEYSSNVFRVGSLLPPHATSGLSYSITTNPTQNQHINQQQLQVPSTSSSNQQQHFVASNLTNNLSSTSKSPNMNNKLHATNSFNNLVLVRRESNVSDISNSIEMQRKVSMSPKLDYPNLSSSLSLNDSAFKFVPNSIFYEPSYLTQSSRLERMSDVGSNNESYYYNNNNSGTTVTTTSAMMDKSGGSNSGSNNNNNKEQEEDSNLSTIDKPKLQNVKSAKRLSLPIKLSPSLIESINNSGKTSDSNPLIANNNNNNYNSNDHLSPSGRQLLLQKFLHPENNVNSSNAIDFHRLSYLYKERKQAEKSFHFTIIISLILYLTGLFIFSCFPFLFLIKFTKSEDVKTRHYGKYGFYAFIVTLILNIVGIAIVIALEAGTGYIGGVLVK
ncbi:hypothetical protein ABK040_003557 [Willaertia magna]